MSFIKKVMLVLVATLLVLLVGCDSSSCQQCQSNENVPNVRDVEILTITGSTKYPTVRMLDLETNQVYTVNGSSSCGNGLIREGDKYRMDLSKRYCDMILGRTHIPRPATEEAKNDSLAEEGEGGINGSGYGVNVPALMLGAAALQGMRNGFSDSHRAKIDEANQRNRNNFNSNSNSKSRKSFSSRSIGRSGRR